MSTSTLDEFAKSKLAALERRKLRRHLATTRRKSSARVDYNDHELISFACNDYLGLAKHPATIAAAVEATERDGVGAGASRLISGNYPLYKTLESKLARLKGTEDAVIFGSGYLANIGTIPVFAGSADLILVDEFSHSCILSGASISRATVKSFRHNDVDSASKILNSQRAKFRRCLIITEGVFSMDGDLAPLPALAELAEHHDAWLMTDDAHGLGVVGGGRGSSFAHDAVVDVPLQMGTLSKAVGAYGGYICATHAVAELIRNRARSFVFSTGLPPATIAAATESIDIIATNQELTARPLTHARRFTHAVDLPEASSAIVPIVVGDVDKSLDASASLAEAGYLVPAIRPPTVPTGTARLRIAFSAVHSDDDVSGLASALESAGLNR